MNRERQPKREENNENFAFFDNLRKWIFRLFCLSFVVVLSWMSRKCRLRAVEGAAMAAVSYEIKYSIPNLICDGERKQGDDGNEK